MSLAFFLTWRCYGTYLHGNTDSVDRKNNGFGSPRREKSSQLYRFERERMDHEPIILAHAMREVVTASIVETCVKKRWLLHAVNVRTNHVHVVVTTDGTPEAAMTTLKAWATRAMRASFVDLERRPIWSRHGSTRHLFTEDAVESAIHYVRDLQDDPARFEEKTER